MKRVFIVHSWGGIPEEGWLRWIKQELEKNNFEVHGLTMPNTDNPVIEEWVSFLKRNVGMPNDQTYFIGHSIGCQTILRYIELLSPESKVGGAVFVAGWVNLSGLNTYEQKIAKPWIQTPIKWGKILTHTKKFVVIFSADDPYVPITDSEIFVNKLDAKIIVEPEKGHFTKVNKLQIALDELLKMAK